jgi:hypothetical protein
MLRVGYGNGGGFTVKKSYYLHIVQVSRWILETNGQLGVEQSERAVPPIHCRQGIGIQNYRRQGDIVGRENSLEAELGLGPRLVAVPQIQMMVIQELKRGHAN